MPVTQAACILCISEVFPDVPLRQWVISFPFPLRYLFAAHPQAMAKVLGTVYRAISTHLIHKAGISLKDGAAADIMSHKLALWMAQLLLALGYALLAVAPDYGLVILACMSIGLAAGGMLPVWGALTAEIFGLTSYGRAFGLIGPIIMIFVMVGSR